MPIPRETQIRFFDKWGIGGGTITRKLLFAVLLIASLSMAGISGASAADVETAQTQITNTNIVQEKVNVKINETNSTTNSTVTQKNVDNYSKIVKKQFKKYKHAKLHKNVTTLNKNSFKHVKDDRIKHVKDDRIKHAKHDRIKHVKHNMSNCTKNSGLKKCTEAPYMSNAYKKTNDIIKITIKNAAKNAKISSNQAKAHTIDITAHNQITATIKDLVNIQNTETNQSSINTTLIPMSAKAVFNQTKMNTAQNGELPAAAGEPKTTGTVSSTNETPMAAGSPTTSKVPASLQPYLKATKNCQVTNAQIKTLAAKITKGKTTTNAKAVAIFNWVRDNLGYSFYYNTKKGAVGTLNAKTGNCVDTAHLLIALSRAAGIPARYVHGNAKFTSGKTYGHVWAEIYVNGKWYKADASSNKNSFGVVKSWTSATIKGRYASLSF